MTSGECLNISGVI